MDASSPGPDRETETVTETETGWGWGAADGQRCLAGGKHAGQRSPLLLSIQLINNAADPPSFSPSRPKLSRRRSARGRARPPAAIRPLTSGQPLTDVGVGMTGPAVGGGGVRKRGERERERSHQKFAPEVGFPEKHSPPPPAGERSKKQPAEEKDGENQNDQRPHPARTARRPRRTRTRR